MSTQKGMEKTFDAKTAEARLYKAWEEAGCFVAGANASKSETFCIMMPPPNVTGSLHVGHAFNHTLQDVLIRWKRMQGFDTLWQPGTDHAGIATQMVTEREMAANGEPPRSEMGREAFLQRVWQQKVKSRGNITGQLRRLGASCDWSREAFTMSGAPGAPEGEDGNFHDAVIRVFVDMYNKGLIYRGKRLVNWDPKFETAISDLEVENIETPGHMWHFKYPLADDERYEYVEKDEDGNVTLREMRDYISIATTRPETMLGDGAVAVHPSDERYAPIVGKLCEIPVGPKEHRRLIPIITDEYPDPEFGSGAVKITGAHDFNDYQVARRNNIPMYSLMDTKGRMRADGQDYAGDAGVAQDIADGKCDFDEAMIAAMNLVPDNYRGLDRFEARKKVVEDITAEGLAVMVAKTVTDAEGNEVETQVPYVENKPIMQPFGDRSKVVIEPMLTDQWFVDTAKIVQPAIDAVRKGDTKILPERAEKVYFHWLENIEPWCISRQLWWGHQVPVWYGPTAKIDKNGTRILFGDNFHSICAINEQEAITKFREYYKGANVIVVELPEGSAEEKASALFGDQLSDKFRDQDNPEIETIGIFRDPDVLDTWFSSGLWPIGTLGWPDETEALKKYFPTNVLTTAHDILFFWVARMMMMQYAVVGEKPFETVYIHALVRDEKGKKMSKSLGNVLDPLELIDEYGADALRFTLTVMAAMGRDLKLSSQRIAGYRNFGTKLWNAVRFAEMNEVYATAPAATPPAAKQTANKWIIGEVGKVREEVDQALESYRFNDAASALYSFVWGKVCDWYVEFSKPLLANDDEAVVAETRVTMGWVLDQCMILLHPIMPFITEELWGATAQRSKMLIHADWPEYTAAQLVEDQADREMSWVIALIEAVRSARGEMRVPAGLKVPLVQLDLDAAGENAFTANEALILKMARIESVSVMDEAPKGSITLPVAGGAFALPLADIIDVGAEKARLQKTLGKLEKELAGLRGRLNNPKFLASAPQEVVAEAKANLEAREDEARKLKAALARLEEIA